MATQLYIIGVIDQETGDELYLDAGLNAGEVEALLDSWGNPELIDCDHDEGWQIYRADKYPSADININNQPSL